MAQAAAGTTSYSTIPNTQESSCISIDDDCNVDEARVESVGRIPETLTLPLDITQNLNSEKR